MEKKPHIEIINWNLQEKSSFSDHTKWEFLKYQTLNFFISFSKNPSKTEQIIETNLERRIKIQNFEQNLKNGKDFNAYDLCKLDLENFFNKNEKGPKLRSKCELHQHGEKLTTCFWNFEKQKPINTTVRHLLVDAEDIIDLKEINTCICNFYKNPFK